MLEDQQRRVERDRACEMRTSPDLRETAARWARSYRSAAIPLHSRARRRAICDSGGIGSMSSVKGIARFWRSVAASSSTARGLTMPKRSREASHSSPSAIASGAVSQRRRLAFVRHRRTSHEIHEHFRRTVIEARERDAFASGDRQIAEPSGRRPIRTACGRS